MPYEWHGASSLRRVHGDDVQPGEEFEPTDAERKSFSKAISETAGDEGEDVNTDTDDGDDAEESSAEDTPLSEMHWRSAVSEVEAGEHDDRLEELAENDDLTDSVQEAVAERQAERSE